MYKDLKEIFKEVDKFLDKEIILQGWIRNHRKQKTFGFIDFYDGTCFKTLQIVYDNELNNFEEITKFHNGSAITVKGFLKKSEGKGQNYELKATSFVLNGDAPEDYPLQPKRHTREFLRELAYLRPRTSLFQAVFRIRSVAAFAIHSYFQELGYVYVNTPLITSNDGEGAGEMFQVTTLDLNRVAREGKIDYTKDFFGRPANLTVTGQLQGEAYAMCYKKIYTFGPTFRAENSNTKTHASEFWMVEPEIAFCNLDGLMDVEEDMLKYVISYVLNKCTDEIDFLDKFVENGLKEKLSKVINSKFVRVDHEEVITILKEAKEKFEFEPKYGEDIAREHEKYITEYFGGPVFIKNWPKDIKAFYMKQNSDNKTVAAVDLEVPGAGELMGGSQREEDFEKLRTRMKEIGVKEEGLEWYMKLRQYGGCIHSGFGMGFERLLIYLTGVDNIRDVIPFPRTPKKIDD